MSGLRSHFLDVYDCWLHLVTTNRELATLRRRHKQIPPRKDGDFGGTMRFRESPADGCDVNHYAIHIDIASHRGNQGELLNTVAHEATHVATGILDSMAERYDADSEALAWLVGWLVRWVWDGVQDG